MNETMRAKVIHKTHVAKAELVTDPMMRSKTQSKVLHFDIPTGRWRDGAFDCCIIPLHPVFLATYCFPLITLGQVMTRINYTFCANRSDGSRSLCPRAFYVMLTIAFFNLFVQGLLVGVVQLLISASNGLQQAPRVGPLHFLVMFGFSIFMLVVHTKTRNRIRRAYSIGDDMSCLGDCCCAFFCTLCSITQMARHTANYHTTHRARCCTPTGLDEEWDDYEFLKGTQYHPDFFNGSQNDPGYSRSTMPMMV